MTEIIAFLKSAYSIFKMIKEVLALFKEVYSMRVKHEHDRRNRVITDRADGISSEIGKPVDDFDHEKVRELLRSRLKK